MMAGHYQEWNARHTMIQQIIFDTLQVPTKYPLSITRIIKNWQGFMLGNTHGMGIAEISIPLALPQEGASFTNALLLVVIPYTYNLKHINL
jgi:hypothetical protein